MYYDKKTIMIVILSIAFAIVCIMLGIISGELEIIKDQCEVKYENINN